MSGARIGRRHGRDRNDAKRTLARRPGRHRRGPADRHAHGTGPRARPVPRRGARWDEDDDRYILANVEQPGRDLALALGRTSYAVYRRRHMLRRWLETEAGKAMRRVRRSERV